MFSVKDSSRGKTAKFTHPRRRRNQSRWISQGKGQAEVDSTHPELQNTTKPTIHQHIGDTKPDTTPNIAEDKSESTPNSRKDNI